MKHAHTKSLLSPAQKQLVESMQKLNFGRIEDLAVRGGEPAFSPPPRIIQDIKLGGDNGPRGELTYHDFVLRSSVIELFDYLERLGDGNVTAIEVRYGLPVRLVIDRSAQELPR